MSIITITPAANQQISNLCQENDSFAITLGIKGGGCAGFEYEWGTAQEKDMEDGDEIVECDNGNLIVQSHAMIYLVGTELDYVKNLVGSNFEIRNPNAQSACGCGVSVNFSV